LRKNSLKNLKNAVPPSEESRALMVYENLTKNQILKGKRKERNEKIKLFLNVYDNIKARITVTARF
jgi:hypothetical protein